MFFLVYFKDCADLKGLSSFQIQSQLRVLPFKHNGIGVSLNQSKLWVLKFGNNASIFEPQ